MHTEQLNSTLEFTEQQKDAVRDTLESLLQSPFFRRSKRYPAFLEFVVLQTLAGNSDQLKERTVADEVFGRVDDYDPSSDPVVRYTAGEVRKRLTLYFSEHPESPVRIELPLGGYTAEFRFRASQAVEPISSGTGFPEVLDAPGTLDQAPAEKTSSPHGFLGRDRYPWVAYACLASVLLLTLLALFIRHSDRRRAGQEFWWPVLHNDSPAVVVVGEGANSVALSGSSGAAPQPLQVPGLPPSPRSNGSSPDDGQVVVGNAVAVSQVCNAFRGYERDCKVIPARSVTLPEIRNNSLVLIGAFDNPLTMQFLSSLRFQLRSQSSVSDTALVSRRIVDRDNRTADTPWKVGQARPLGDSDTDYAILARFHSDINDGMVVVIAGLGPQATHATGDYVSSAKLGAMQEIAARAPNNWNGMNFEAVLQIDLMRGSPGHVRVLASQYW